MDSTVITCPDSQTSVSNEGTYYYHFLGKDTFNYWKHIGVPFIILMLLIILNMKLMSLLKHKIIKLKSPNT
jgi:hypothetical protein